MNRLVIIDDFDETKSIAHQIDEGFNYLDQKLSSVSRFGLSLKPEETRAKAENLLKNVQEEIDCMKFNIESCSDEQKQILVDTIADNSSIQDFLEKTQREVNEVEEFFRSRKNYQPYIPNKMREDCTAEGNVSPEAEQLILNSDEGRSSLDSNMTVHNFNQNKTLSTLKNSSTACMNSPGNMSCRLNEIKSLVNTQSNFEKSFDDLQLNFRNNALRPRKLITADDTLRTPGNFITKSIHKKSSRSGRSRVKNEITSVH